MPPNGSGLTITNPLVLYRSLVATNRIKPDPAQHRLALHLQNLYERLIDYEPSVEYSQRLQQLGRAVGTTQDVPSPSSSTTDGTLGIRGIWTSLLAQKEKRDSLALTRVLTSHEAAMNLQSPKGLMLHGEVGTGKSMLIDTFASCLPSHKKRRWHFNTFMLDTFSRLEQLRKSPPSIGPGAMRDEYSLLWLARDLVETSPILFLDEFQLPDRAASKILSNLMTSFFQLGGVLIATSNRMPEELAKAAGMEFKRPVSRLSRLGWRLGIAGVVGRDNRPGQKGEFAQFLEVLRARCDIWEIEGKRDYRRLAGEEDGAEEQYAAKIPTLASMPASAISGSPNMSPAPPDSATASSISLPKHYLVQPTPATLNETLTNLLTPAPLLPTSPPVPIPWTSTTLTVYSRPLPIPRTHSSTAYLTFAELCGAPLGPADYITLASTYPTLILTDIPILTHLQKNEARRLITLLDALYEARCRLLITAAAGPDELFFPETPTSTSTPTSKAEPSSHSASPDAADPTTNDAVYPETFSEIHQDLTSPFRPNISSYTALSSDALEDDPPNRARRAGSSFTDERALDFANIGGLTGEDERFAVERAKSRMWEMCSRRWWARTGEGEGEAEGEAGWWRPLPLELRHWERTAGNDTLAKGTLGVVQEPGVENAEDMRGVDAQQNMFEHGASPFRTAGEAPPKINWTHVWGTMKWGKRAGPWGKGVEGLEDRKKESKSSDVANRGKE
ncbi:AFG1-like ATPase-domain-containing protein [Massariosphaeria phaeospora]|uniref:AFG1-like ATPase-domain-containing protein n=1 Tax=Massariosphaeria phaeospora TaxID=100035 RepID=A0A7C8M747_9PLEO|nr:AFG1-like ATPase-domain-containing protein [Massariosphaeria phaeospora]